MISRQSGSKKNDRLEPSGTVQDVGTSFDQHDVTSTGPLRMCFWRRSEETATRHRCPLICAALHTSPQTLIIDILHAWYLGIFQRYLGHLWWEFIENNMFGVRDSNMETLIGESVQRMRNLLTKFYEMYHARFPLDRISELSDLSLKTLGPRQGTRYLKAKGAETRPLISYTSWLVRTHPGKLPAEDGVYLLGLDSLEQMYTICKDSPNNMRPHELGELCNHLKRHYRAMRILNISFVPKHHLTAHIPEFAALHGNPRASQLFLHEHYNGLMARIGKCCHRRSFYWRLITEFYLAYGPAGVKESLLKRMKRLRG